jgi:hypothetical protein
LDFFGAFGAFGAFVVGGDEGGVLQLSESNALSMIALATGSSFAWVEDTDDFDSVASFLDLGFFVFDDDGMAVVVVAVVAVAVAVVAVAVAVVAVVAAKLKASNAATFCVMCLDGYNSDNS